MSLSVGVDWIISSFSHRISKILFVFDSLDDFGSLKGWIAIGSFFCYLTIWNKTVMRIKELPFIPTTWRKLLLGTTMLLTPDLPTVIQGIPSILKHFRSKKSLVRIEVETKSRSIFFFNIRGINFLSRFLNMSPEFSKVNIVIFPKHFWILFLTQF